MKVLSAILVLLVSAPSMFAKPSQSPADAVKGILLKPAAVGLAIGTAPPPPTLSIPSPSETSIGKSETGMNDCNVTRSADGDSFPLKVGICSKYLAKNSSKSGQCVCRDSLQNPGTFMPGRDRKFKCQFNNENVFGCRYQFVTNETLRFVKKSSKLIGALNLKTSDCISLHVSHVYQSIGSGAWQEFYSHHMYFNSSSTGSRNQLVLRHIPNAVWERDYAGYLIKVSLECIKSDGLHEKGCVGLKFDGKKICSKEMSLTSIPESLTKTELLKTLKSNMNISKTEFEKNLKQPPISRLNKFPDALGKANRSDRVTVVKVDLKNKLEKKLSLNSLKESTKRLENTKPSSPDETPGLSLQIVAVICGAGAGILLLVIFAAGHHFYKRRQTNGGAKTKDTDIEGKKKPEQEKEEKAKPNHYVIQKIHIFSKSVDGKTTKNHVNTDQKISDQAA